MCKSYFAAQQLWPELLWTEQCCLEPSARPEKAQQDLQLWRRLAFSIWLLKRSFRSSLGNFSCFTPRQLQGQSVHCSLIDPAHWQVPVQWTHQCYSLQLSVVIVLRLISVCCCKITIWFQGWMIFLWTLWDTFVICVLGNISGIELKEGRCRHERYHCLISSLTAKIHVLSGKDP